MGLVHKRSQAGKNRYCANDDDQQEQKQDGQVRRFHSPPIGFGFRRFVGIPLHVSTLSRRKKPY